MRLWASVYCTATLLSWALGVTVDEKASTEKCGCTTATLPHPRIVLVGSTGVGKSTFGNRLFGITEHSGKEALCSQFDGYKYNNETDKKEWVGHKFGTGHSTESHTNTTDWMVGHYLGDPSNPCITIIDTPGIGDTENRDCQHGIALAKGIKEIGSINAFMLLFQGVDARFNKDIQEQIDLYLGIFGTEMWHNTITEFTYWSHDHRRIQQRYEVNNGLNMTVKHAGWNREYANRFSPTTQIPSVFIDPVYNVKWADENEKKINTNQTDLLWKLLNDPSRTEFKCDKRCKAPSGFFSGQPWLLEDGAQKKRLEDRASIKWQIWFADCDGTGTKSYMIKHESVGGQTTLLYQLKDEDNTTTIEDFLFPNMTVENETGDKLKTIRLTLDSLADNHFGTYFIENEKGVSNKSQIIKVVDGEWEDFGPFGDCSKTCIKNINEPLGSKRRERRCKPPQNGGRPCKGKAFEEKECAHLPGEKGEIARFCPVDAKWSGWFDWSRCSANCKRDGEPVPEKSRLRICQQEQYGGKGCDVLKNLAKAKNQPLMEERQNCTELPNCPIPASLNPWTEWSACTKTCYEEGTAQPQSTRKRTCKKEVITDPTLGISVDTCESLGEVDDILPCNTGFCPVDPTWSSWTAWAACSATCGDSGMRRRDRGFTPGRYGAEPAPTSGSAAEEEPCNRNKCPVAAKWSWTEWSSCDIDCYKPDGYRGSRKRKNLCEEGNPKHQFLNCLFPPGGFEQIDRPCPGLTICPSLMQISAKVSRRDCLNWGLDWVPAGGDCWSGTDSGVSVMLKNSATGQICETGGLDNHGDTWQPQNVETFTKAEYPIEFGPCSNFFMSPNNSLQFIIKLDGGDGLRLDSVMLDFGNGNDIWMRFAWAGKRWFSKERNALWVPISKV